MNLKIMNEELRGKFLKVYYNLPLGIREEVIYVFDEKPMTWNAVFIEVNAKTEIGEKIFPYEIKTRDEIFESDKIQLAAYALLLEEEFGKKVEKGVIETSKSKQEVELDKGQKLLVLEIIEKIRNLDKENPGFQNNLSKCRSCKFNELCFDT